MYLLENCQLEWDQPRGVLYIHNKDTGATVVRISNLVVRGMEVDSKLVSMDVNADILYSTVTTEMEFGKS